MASTINSTGTSSGVTTTADASGVLELQGGGNTGVSIDATGQPTLAPALGTSFNRVTVTAPATTATLTLADNSTLATAGAYSGTLTFTNTSNVTFPTTGTLATMTAVEAAETAAAAAAVTAESAADIAVAAAAGLLTGAGAGFNTTPVFVVGVGYCSFLLVDYNKKPFCALDYNGQFWLLNDDGYLTELVMSSGGGTTGSNNVLNTSAISLPGVGNCAVAFVDANKKPFSAIGVDGSMWALGAGGVLTQVGGTSGAEDYTGGAAYLSIYNTGDTDRQPWAYSDANVILMVPVVGQSLAIGSNPDVGAQFTGDIAGTTLNVTSVVTRADGTSTSAITLGRVLTGTGVTAGTRVVSGSGATWTVDTSQTVASTTITIAVDTARTTTSTYPDNVLMFGLTGESYGLPRPAGADVDRFVACVEADGPGAGDGGSVKETICTAFGNTLYARITSKVTATPKILMAIAGTGGTPYRGMQRGSTNYTELLRLVERAVQIAAASGNSVVVPGFIIQHGETNNGDVTEEYARYLTQWRANVEADIRAITGQYEPVRALIPQCNRRSASSSTTASTPLSPLLADKMDPYIVCVGPIYDVDADSTSTHPLSYGYTKMAVRYGYAAFDEWFDVGYRPLRAIEAYWQTSTTFRIKYNRPVTVDASNAIINTVTDITANMGFIFKDGSGVEPTVSGAALVGGSTNTIELTLSGAYTGLNPRFLYATYSTVAAMGRVTGPRGCIRATPSWGTAVDAREASGTVPVYDWACTETIYPGLGVVP